MSEMQKLLNELKKAQEEEVQRIINNADTWRKVAKNDWQGLGLKSKEELTQWISDNPYSNI